MFNIKVKKKKGRYTQEFKDIVMKEFYNPYNDNNSDRVMSEKFDIPIACMARITSEGVEKNFKMAMKARENEEQDKNDN